MDLLKLRVLLTSIYGEDKCHKCFADIQDIMINTILSVQKAIISDKHCFEL